MDATFAVAKTKPEKNSPGLVRDSNRIDLCDTDTAL